MNRQQAINNIMAVWSQRDQEFCVGLQEHEESDQEMRDSLKALGVTDREMK